MTKAQAPLSDQDLDTLFDTVRKNAPAPPASLISAVLTDAADVVAMRRTTPVAIAPGGLRKRFAALLDGLGGWQGAATVAASGVFGLWIGYADLGSSIEILLNGESGLDPIATLEHFNVEE